MNTYNAKTLVDEGWYYFKPEFESTYSGPERFVFISIDVIEDNLLTTKSSQGTYTGPIDLKKIGEQEKELARFKEGNLTEEEFHNLCHNKEKAVTLDEFCSGCELYQKKLFGESPITKYKNFISWIKRRVESGEHEDELMEEIKEKLLCLETI